MFYCLRKDRISISDLHFKVLKFQINNNACTHFRILFRRTMYITRVKMLNNHGSQIIDWIKAIWAVFKIFWSNFCFHRIMWRHYSFASFSLPKGSSLFLTTFVQLSNPTVFNSPSHLTLSPILSLLYFYRFALLFLQLFHPTCTPLFHTTFSLKSSLPIEVSHIIRQTLSTQFFLFFSLSF